MRLPLQPLLFEVDQRALDSQCRTLAEIDVFPTESKYFGDP